MWKIVHLSLIHRSTIFNRFLQAYVFPWWVFDVIFRFCTILGGNLGAKIRQLRKAFECTKGSTGDLFSKAFGHINFQRKLKNRWERSMRWLFARMLIYLQAATDLLGFSRWCSHLMFTEDCPNSQCIQWEAATLRSTSCKPGVKGQQGLPTI